MNESDAQPAAGRRVTVGAIGAKGVEADRDTVLAAVARETRRLLEEVQDARLRSPPTPEEALRLKVQWERLTRWSAGVIGGSGTGDDRDDRSLAGLLWRCRDELTAFLAAANREASRRDDAPV